MLTTVTLAQELTGQPAFRPFFSFVLPPYPHAVMRELKNVFTAVGKVVALLCAAYQRMREHPQQWTQDAILQTNASTHGG
jgi:hypothetical protein